MNKEWSVKELYNGFDSPEFIADEKALDNIISKMIAFFENIKGESTEALKTGIWLMSEFKRLSTKLFCFAELNQATNTADVNAAATIGRLSQKISAVAGPSTIFSHYVAGIKNLDLLIENDSDLKEFKFLLNNLCEEEKYTLSPEVENVMSLYSISGTTAWSELQGYLTSTVPVEYDGGITSLSDIRNKAYDADKNIRKSAYEAEIKAYDRIKDAIAYSLNSIKLETINRCKLRGYESPLDEALKNANMKRETLDALIGAMEEFLPKFWEYLKAKARLLGYTNGLPWYDLFAPLEGNEKKYTTEECKQMLIDLFSGFDKEEADVIAKAFDNEWIDFYPHNGKVGGAFCMGIHPIGEFRILTNYGGTLGDVVTLAHELGHGFHDYCLKENNILNSDYSMPVAETASTFNEVVAMNAAISNETDPIAKRALIENQLMDATQIICDIYSRYLFETTVFNNRNNEFMFADRLCDIMLDTQKKAYGDGLDQNYLHQYMWACKSHYYGSLSFYNFPYAFGGLFARGLYAKYLKDGSSFVPLYKKLLKATGSTSVEGAAAIAGIDLTQKQFWRDSLKILSDEIDEFIELCK